MIHKNIYSQRIKDTDEVEPYFYEMVNERIRNSFNIFFGKFVGSNYNKFIIKSIEDFCETKGLYISTWTESHLCSGSSYSINNCKQDLRKLIDDYMMPDILDFIDICIANLNIEILESVDYQKCNLQLLKISFIDLLNEMLEHNNLGYELVNDIIVTKQSDFLHIEAVCKPLTLLKNEEFNGALKEFENAIVKYTEHDYEHTIIEACKAYESTMKSILDKLGVEYDKDRCTASALLNLLKEKGLFDSFMADSLSKVTNILSSGLPTVRNKVSGHGDGLEIVEVKRSYASFAINLAGTYIVLLIDRYYEMI